MEEMDIVIVGGGVAGLATSLALHRKGIKSVVLERAERVRSEGAALGVNPNGWRALEHLGVDDKLRPISLPIHQIRSVFIENGRKHESVEPAAYGEVRCIKRNDLVKALADDLPDGTIRFGYQIVDVKLDETTSFPVLKVKNGRDIKAKVLIGCDGANSAVAKFLRLNPTKVFGSRAVRGFTSCPDGHGLPPELLTWKIDNVLCGRIPVAQNLLFWFIYFPSSSQEISKDREAIAKMTLGSINKFPDEVKEMVKNCDRSSVYMSNVRYRAPWDILFGRFRRGTVTVSGDAMHLMGPFLGQGGCSALEDAVVLGRCLARKLEKRGGGGSEEAYSAKGMEEAIDEYVRERRMRLVALTTQVYLTGLCVRVESRLMKVMVILLLMILFYDRIHHTRYDCSRL